MYSIYPILHLYQIQAIHRRIYHIRFRIELTICKLYNYLSYKKYMINNIINVAI
jgi:hypothetical protein